jgi:hypothetical protein
MAGAGTTCSGRARGRPGARAPAGDADPQPRRTVAAGRGRVRRQPLRQPEHRGRRCPLRRDALHHAGDSRRARRARPRLPRRSRRGGARPAEPDAATGTRCAAPRPRAPRRARESTSRSPRRRARDGRSPRGAAADRNNRRRRHQPCPCRLRSMRRARLCRGGRGAPKHGAGGVPRHRPRHGT